MVEKSVVYSKQIQETSWENIKKLEVREQTKVFSQDVFSSLKKLEPSLFDIVYIDPPYGEKKQEAQSEKIVCQILHYLDTQLYLAPDAWVFLEFSIYSSFDFNSLDLKTLKLTDVRTFARTKLHLFKKT